jgi:hypothetical protein
MARKLLLVPILVVALFVAILDAPATPPSDRGWNVQEVYVDQGSGWVDHRPMGVGHGRRVK